MQTGPTIGTWGNSRGSIPGDSRSGDRSQPETHLSRSRVPNTRHTRSDNVPILDPKITFYRFGNCRLVPALVGFFRARHQMYDRILCMTRKLYSFAPGCGHPHRFWAADPVVVITLEILSSHLALGRNLHTLQCLQTLRWQEDSRGLGRPAASWRIQSP